MEDQKISGHFNISTDKSLVVATFLAVLLFIVLFTVVNIVNRNNGYTQTAIEATVPVSLEIKEDLNEMEEELSGFEAEFDEMSKSNLEPELEIDLTLEE